jgi:hypothetical protein
MERSFEMNDEVYNTKPIILKLSIEGERGDLLEQCWLAYKEEAGPFRDERVEAIIKNVWYAGASSIYNAILFVTNVDDAEKSMRLMAGMKAEFEVFYMGKSKKGVTENEEGS